MAFKAINFIAIVGCAALGSATALSAQSVADDAATDASDDSEIAESAQDAIRTIDPTTGQPAKAPLTSRIPTAGSDTPAEAFPELPFALPLLAFDEVTYGSVRDEASQPRGPAARMISEPQVQDVPDAAPSAASPKSPSDDPFVIKSILPVAGTIGYGEWFWDETAAPASGELVVTVDLDARVISVFRDGHEIGTAVALLGTTSHPTPLGTFPILTKERDNVSEKYDNAPMPWTLRLTWDGIAIHGSPVMNGFASHGCIGVPDPFAEKLFDAARRGDKVVITRGKYVAVGDRIMS